MIFRRQRYTPKNAPGSRPYTIDGWIYDGLTVVPIHRLQNGRYLRRHRDHGWTPFGRFYSRVFATRQEAQGYKALCQQVIDEGDE
jgi:hypothetical protein